MKKASFTVEAAFVMPVCIFIIIVLIYTVFIMHDRACLYIEAGKFAEENRLRTYADTAKEQAALKKELQERCEKHLFVCSIKDMEIKYNMLNVVIRLKITSSIKIFGEYDMNSKYYIADYSRTIRSLEAVKQ